MSSKVNKSKLLIDLHHGENKNPALIGWVFISAEAVC
jgi:hypothetical protein